MTTSEYFKDWLDVIDQTELNKLIPTLNYLYSTKPIVPAYSDIFRAFTLCSKASCRVVFLSQDPYPQEGVATGLVFANKIHSNSISPSLKVIISSIMSMKEEVNKDFDITLESWAKQGILLLNSALTCEVNKIGSHTMLWRPFISKFLLSLSSQNKDIVYVLFGNQAQTFEPYIKGTILKERHPAFYARINAPMPNKIFYDINAAISGEPIHWCSNS